jgi:hypothetical protein
VRRWGAGTAAIARLLVAADAPLTGVAIADAVGVSQPRASQVLKQLAEQQAVRATERGYVGRPARLLDLYSRRARPLLIQPETYWYSTRPMAEHAQRIADTARKLRAPIAFSADLAPDLIVPWRHPTLTVIYTAKVLQLDTAGLVPAEGRADASVVLRWTSDDTLLSPAAGWPSAVDDIPLTDPVQQWCDLLDLGGDDRREAADRLRRAIVDRTIPSAA